MAITLTRQNTRYFASQHNLIHYRKFFNHATSLLWRYVIGNLFSLFGSVRLLTFLQKVPSLCGVNRTYGYSFGYLLVPR